MTTTGPSHTTARISSAFAGSAAFCGTRGVASYIDDASDGDYPVGMRAILATVAFLGACTDADSKRDEWIAANTRPCADFDDRPSYHLLSHDECRFSVAGIEDAIGPPVLGVVTVGVHEEKGGASYGVIEGTMRDEWISRASYEWTLDVAGVPGVAVLRPQGQCTWVRCD